MSVWNEEWTVNPEAFNSFLRAQRRDAYKEYRAGNLAPLCAFIELLRELRNFASSDPWINSYDSHTVGAYLILAEHWLDQLEFEPALDSLCSGWSLLQEKARRLALLHQTPLPESENKYRLLTWLADLKWKGPARYRNEILLPLEMWELYECVEARLHESVVMGRRGPFSADNLDYGLAWCGVLLLNVGQRYQPAYLPKWRDAYEALHPGVLQNEGHPARWQWRIGEYVLGDRVSESYLRALYNSRNAAVQSLRGSQFPLRSVTLASRREQDYLLVHGGEKLQLVASSA